MFANRTGHNRPDFCSLLFWKTGHSFFVYNFGRQRLFCLSEKSGFVWSNLLSWGVQFSDAFHGVATALIVDCGRNPPLIQSGNVRHCRSNLSKPVIMSDTDRSSHSEQSKLGSMSERVTASMSVAATVASWPAGSGGGCNISQIKVAAAGCACPLACLAL